MAFDFLSNRRERRSATGRTAVIKLGMFKSIDCDVKDMSASGARLVLPANAKLPEHFPLKLIGSGKKRIHKCALRWQEENIVGVEFLSAKIG